MQINLKLNGKTIKEEIADDLLLIDFVRKHGCYSVKRGCETANCGLCTVVFKWQTGVILLGADSQSQRTGSDHAGRSPARGGRDRFLPGRPGSGAVRFLQSGIYHECICDAQRDQRSHRGADQRISCGKSVQMFRFCFPDKEYPEVPEI